MTEKKVLNCKQTDAKVTFICLNGLKRVSELQGQGIIFGARWCFDATRRVVVKRGI